MCHLDAFLNITCRHYHHARSVALSSNIPPRDVEGFAQSTPQKRNAPKRHPFIKWWPRHGRNGCCRLEEYYGTKWSDIVQDAKASGDKIVGWRKIELWWHKVVSSWKQMTMAPWWKTQAAITVEAVISREDESETEGDFDEYMRILDEKYKGPGSSF